MVPSQHITVPLILFIHTQHHTLMRLAVSHYDIINIILIQNHQQMYTVRAYQINVSWIIYLLRVTRQAEKNKKAKIIYL